MIIVEKNFPLMIWSNLLEELKSKPYRFLLREQNLVPLINANFVDKNGKAFKYINQNKSGANNYTVRNMPRGGQQLKDLLQRLYTPIQ